MNNATNNIMMTTSQQQQSAFITRGLAADLPAPPPDVMYANLGGLVAHETDFDDTTMMMNLEAAIDSGGIDPSFL